MLPMGVLRQLWWVALSGCFSVSSVSLFVYFSIFIDCKLSWLAWTKCLGFSWILPFSFLESWLSGHPSWPVSHLNFILMEPELNSSSVRSPVIVISNKYLQKFSQKNFSQSSFNLICCAFDSLQYYLWSFIFLLFLRVRVFFLQVIFNHCLMHMGSSRMSKTCDVCH